MKKNLDQKFLNDINKKLLASVRKTTRPKEAKEIAKSIITTIPHLVSGYFQNRHRISVSPFTISIYSNYENELIDDEPYEGKDTLTCFKKGTVGYYLCHYLSSLNFVYTVWLGEVSIVMTYLSGNDATSGFLKPFPDNIK